ncbi:hypothetical protein Tsubulata_029639, partial [Turnera subulata]
MICTVDLVVHELLGCLWGCRWMCGQTGTRTRNGWMGRGPGEYLLSKAFLHSLISGGQSLSYQP